ncbi:MFS general substrate transporter [Clavulina sp. PMI_390]|nr:MFS general substrate transporter [Clavulina sp. PMI_390]
MLEVSTRLRIIQVACSIFFCLTSAGVIFGYAALKPVLIKKGVYSDFCADDDEGWPECTAQDLRLNYMFTLSAVVTNTFALPIGILLDNVGPRNTSLLGAIFFALGNFLFGLEMVTSHIDTYFLGYVFLAIGGPMIFLSQFHLSNVFPKNSGLVLSLIVGAFDCSSFPYLIYRALDDKLNISIRAWFWGYLIIPALLVTQQLTIAPRVSYKQGDFEELAPTLSGPGLQSPRNPDSDYLDEEGALAGAMRRRSSARNSFGAGFSTKTSDRPVLDAPAHFDDPLMGAMADAPLRKQLTSSYFLLIVFFLCTYMGRINYEIQTVTSQLLYYLEDRDMANTIATAFTILLPVGGVVGIPIIGALLDRQGSGPTSIVVFFMGLGYGLLGIMPFAPAQLFAIGIFVILRPLMYTFMGDYTGRAFGFETFGTVYGLLNCIAGLSGLILRPVDLLVKGALAGNYTIPNIVGIVLGCISTALITWRIYKKPRGEIALLEDDGDDVFED